MERERNEVKIYLFYVFAKYIYIYNKQIKGQRTFRKSYEDYRSVNTSEK
jgi:hypothetical protein